MSRSDLRTRCAPSPCPLSVLVMALALPGLALGGGAFQPGFARYWHKNQPGVLGQSTPDEQYGFALAVGDFDCDGFDDLAAGIPYQDKTVLDFVLPEAGAVNVLYGSPAGLTATGNQLLVSPRGGGGHFGFALAATPVDGFPACNNLLVGAPGLDSGQGRIFRYMATLGGLQLESSDGLRLNDFVGSGAAGDRFGHSIAASPEFADGTVALAIGLPGRAVDGKAESGAVLAVRTGPSGSYTRLITLIDSAVGATAQAAARFGWSLAFHDDNADLLPDIIVGSPFHDTSGFTDAGIVHVLYTGQGILGASGEPVTASLFPGPGVTSQQFFGHTLAARSPASGQASQFAIGAVGTFQGLPGAGAVFVRSIEAAVGGNATHSYTTFDGDDFGVAQNFDQLGHGLAYALRDGGSGTYHGDYMLAGLPGEGGDVGAVGIKPHSFGTTQGYPVMDQASLFSAGANELDDRFGQVIATGDFNGRGGQEAVIAMPTEDVSAGAPTAVDAGSVIEVSWDPDYDAPLFADSFEGAPL